MRHARRSAVRRWVLALALVAVWWACPALSAPAEEEQLRNAGVVWTPREVLFYSAPAGQWTAVRLDAGERILQRGVNGNVAGIVTSQRDIGFSAPLNAVHEVSVPEDENLEGFKTEGNIITFVTGRRVFGFSAYTGKWAVLDRFQLGR